MHVLGLYHTVFTDPKNPDMPQPDLKGWSTVYDFVDGLTTNPLYNALVTSNEEKYIAWVLACIVPFARTPSPNSQANPRKFPPPATMAAKIGIKAPNKVSDLITGAVMHREEIVELRDVVLGSTERMNERDLFGMAIRRWETHGTHWRLQVFFAILDDVMSRAQAADGEVTSSSESKKILCYHVMSPFTDGFPVLKEIVDSWKAFIDYLQQLDLMDAPSIKPLVDGRQLSQALNIKPGKWMASALEVCMAWQLRNPQTTDPAGAVDEVRQRKKELGIAELLK